MFSCNNRLEIRTFALLLTVYDTFLAEIPIIAAYIWRLNGFRGAPTLHSDLKWLETRTEVTALRCTRVMILQNTCYDDFGKQTQF